MEVPQEQERNINDEAMTEAQLNELEEFYRRMANEEKGIDNFFLEVIRTKDTTKVGNLLDEEVGVPQLPVRTLLELSEDCEIIPSMSSFAKSFKVEAEQILATSLSRRGFLIERRVTQKKEFDNKQKKKQQKKGLFGGGKDEAEEQ